MDKVYAALLAALFLTGQAWAECRSDRFGEVFCGRGKCVVDPQGKVFCARHQFGDAVVTRHGQVVCGKGDCALGKALDRYMCSRVEGGGAVVDQLGAVKCYGGCEEASAALCEQEKGR